MPTVTSTSPHRSVAWAEMTAHIEAVRPEDSGARRLTEALADPRPRWAAPRLAPGRERAVDADLPLDREAPDRPAGRLVAVVTVRNRVVPLRRHHGDHPVGGFRR